MKPRSASKYGAPRGISAYPRTMWREGGRDDGEIDADLAARFEILGLAGAGGMGEVHRARDRATGQIVAVKRLPQHGGDVVRFEREAEVLASLDHPAIVRHLESGVTSQGARYLVMEWLSGRDLEEELAHRGLSVDEALTLGKRLAEALAVVHAAGLVHRDLKPGNVFLVDGSLGAAKILDFGLARAVNERGLTVPGVVIGTPSYMAPEQVRDDDLDARADVYALGAVLFRCLARRPPFSGANAIAVLAKVLVEAPPRLRDFVAEPPAALEALLLRMLDKNPARRPDSGAAVLEELRAIGEGALVARLVPPAITAREQRIASVVLCASRGGREVTITSREQGRELERIREAVEDCGGSLDALDGTTLLVTIRDASSPAEQAARAARSALAVSMLRPSAPIVVAMGRVVVAGDVQVGEVIDRASTELERLKHDGAENTVLIDDATAALLDDRFDVEGSGARRRLVGERVRSTPMRTLLGRPSACVGRAPELALLSSVLAECIERSCASPVLVTAPPGLGKSRLLHEFLATLPTRGVGLLLAHGDAMRAGSPFGMASQVVMRAASILASDPQGVRAEKLRSLIARHFEGRDARRLVELFGEICGASTPHGDASPELRAARADVTVMSDALREAWSLWLRRCSYDAALVLVFEDAQWADLPSLRLAAAALEALADRPLMLLATSRPDDAAKARELWKSRGLKEMKLGPLPRRAAVRLARDALGESYDDAKIEDLVARAGGHPFHLEELVRAVASGQTGEALPDNILGMIQARLDVVGANARRILRAASVFGDTFWAGGVAALVGDAIDADEIGAHLADLAAQEIVSKRTSARFKGESELAFRHALVRDAAYEMLTESDRRLAHRLAGAWLEGKGESDAAVLAEHYDQGAAPERAVGFFRRAAEQALEGNDFDRALRHLERALACGPERSMQASLVAIQAEVTYWRGDLDTAARRAAEAVSHLRPGDANWFDAIAVAMGALGQQGRNDAVAEWLLRAADAESLPEARGHHAVALCRGLLQLLWAHHGADLRRVRARLERLVEADDLEPYAAGWVHRVRGESAWLHEGDVDRCLAEIERSSAAFERAHALRALCLARVNGASLAGWSGAVEEGLAMTALSQGEAVRLGSAFLSVYALAIKGLLLAYAGDPAAAPTMSRALEGVGGSPRLAFVAHAVIGWLAADRGAIDEAEASAERALALPVVADLQPAALAIRSRVRAARGDHAGAVREALAAVRVQSTCKDLELTVGLADLALAEAHAASGDHEAARQALAHGYERLQAIAKRIALPERRTRFWARRMANDKIHALAKAWDLAD